MYYATSYRGIRVASAATEAPTGRDQSIGRARTQKKLRISRSSAKPHNQNQFQGIKQSSAHQADKQIRILLWPLTLTAMGTCCGNKALVPAEPLLSGDNDMELKSGSADRTSAPRASDPGLGSEWLIDRDRLEVGEMVGSSLAGVSRHSQPKPHGRIGQGLGATLWPPKRWPHDLKYIHEEVRILHALQHEFLVEFLGMVKGNAASTS